MEVPGLLRPWMLSFRSDFGISGFIDPEQAVMLMELIASEGSKSQNSRDVRRCSFIPEMRGVFSSSRDVTAQRTYLRTL